MATASKDEEKVEAKHATLKEQQKENILQFKDCWNDLLLGLNAKRVLELSENEETNTEADADAHADTTTINSSSSSQHPACKPYNKIPHQQTEFHVKVKSIYKAYRRKIGMRL